MSEPIQEQKLCRAQKEERDRILRLMLEFTIKHINLSGTEWYMEEFRNDWKEMLRKIGEKQ
jgi:hypothetical protein